MKEIDGGFDLLTAVVALVLMLTVCGWSVAAMRKNSEVFVDEKTTIYNAYGQAVVKTSQTAKDALMSLVVNDAYVPYPSTVVFQLGRESYSVTFDNNFFADKEVSINRAWDEFFKNVMDTKIESTTVAPDGTRWIVKLVR